ncbi:Rep family protein [Salinicoccus sp. CNSTN-B1]
MKKTQTKARYFTFIIYPESIPEDWEDRLTSLGLAMAVSPLHDKDKSEVEGQEFKKAHYHVLYVARNPVTTESVRKKIKRTLGDKSLSHIEIVDNVEHVYLYLTHESKDAIKKNKYKYAKKDIKFINDFDIDRYVFLDENEKRELKNKLLNIVQEKHLVNVIDLMGYLQKYGSEHGITNMSDVYDVVTSSPGGFRLWFEGNYQCGYRARYSQKIDPETGEIK